MPDTPTDSAVLTTAGQLARSILAVRDVGDRMDMVAAACRILAEAMDDRSYGTDVACHFYDAEKDALRVARDDREAAEISEELVRLRIVRGR